MTAVVPKQVVALRFESGTLHALDQTLLPFREHWLELRSAEEVADAIRRLAIRGAPLIGVAAAYGVALEQARDPDRLEAACKLLRDARPTAVNLFWALRRVQDAALASSPGDRAIAALAEASAIEREEEAASAAIADHGAELLAGSRRVLTHCNTGSLAAPGRGTALGVIAELAQRAGVETVLVTESRPLLQGARLTTYELSQLDIPHQLVVDGAAAGLIARGAAEAVIVGCDRVAANGDVANKVGTYPIALAASASAIPFVVAAPISTIDPACPDGEAIELEERDPDEVRCALEQPLTLPNVACRNLAFDITPARLVTALVTERGVARPVGPDSIRTLLET